MGQLAHPCVRCGACCAFFRVTFYWREANTEDHENAVPAGFFEDLNSMSRCMKGTSQTENPKCVALKGAVGRNVVCSIYENRPSPCRDFEASLQYGNPNPRCDRARAKHRLPPLTAVDWYEYRLFSVDGGMQSVK